MLKGYNNIINTQSSQKIFKDNKVAENKILLK
jgi:hypothetical protein